MNKVSPRLLEKVTQKSVMDVVVFLKDEFLHEWVESPRCRIENIKPEKIRNIERSVMVTQAKLLADLESNMAKPESYRYMKRKRKRKKSFPDKSVRQNYLFNAVMMPVDATGLKGLGKNPDVLVVVDNFRQNITTPIKTSVSTKPYNKKKKVTWGIDDLEINKMWKAGYTGEGISIGHLDTGVFGQHPDLAGKIDAFAAFSPFGESIDSDPYESDPESHGTHTAGTLVGGEESGIKIGVAPRAKLVSGLVLPGGVGRFWQILSGINWAARRNISVLSMSLGSGGYIDAYSSVSARLLEAGIFPAFAIGNDGLGITSSPANLPAVCGVGAYDQEHDVAPFSSGGAFTWKDGISIKPDLVAPGVNVHSSVREPKRPPFGPSWASYDGTSMATPHVAASVALLMQAVPNATVREIMDAIYGTCKHPYGQGGQDHRYGRGFFRPFEALQKLET